MDTDKIEETLGLHSENINGLMDNQLALTSQVQVLQAALATALLHHPDRPALLHHPDRPTLLATFQQYMKISKQSAPQLASRMEALESGMLALLGQHQA